MRGAADLSSLYPEGAPQCAGRLRFGSVEPFEARHGGRSSPEHPSDWAILRDTEGAITANPITPVDRIAVCVAVTASVAVFLGFAATATARPDQVQPDTDSSSLLVGGTLYAGQTFTAGLTGPLQGVQLLMSVDPSCRPDGELIVTIREASGGVPAGPVLERQSYPAELLQETPTFADVGFSQGHVIVYEGEPYAILARAPDAGFCEPATDANWAWNGINDGSAYPDGTALQSPDAGGTWTPLDGYDTAFETLVVPARCKGEPATILGTYRADTLVGTRRRDVIYSFEGADTIRGRGGNDLICGASGSDRITGGSGRDFLKGIAARDILKGSSGNDRLKGGGSGDRLNGGRGRDICGGGIDKDKAKKCEAELGVEQSL
jgi:hypothetical protein